MDNSQENAFDVVFFTKVASLHILKFYYKLIQYFWKKYFRKKTMVYQHIN